LPHTPTTSSYVIWSSSSVTSSAAAAASKVQQCKSVSGLFCRALVSPALLLSTYIYFSRRNVFIQ